MVFRMATQDIYKIYDTKCPEEKNKIVSQIS